MIKIIAVLATAVALVAAQQAQGHTIPKKTCYAVAKKAGPYQSLRWKVAFAKCNKKRKRHNAAHKLDCAHLGVQKTIRCVFGKWGGQAVRVARCESGLSTTASNGQYKGLFQMGSNERATYGHGSTALAQARAAFRYFKASGYDWSPWACKP